MHMRPVAARVCVAAVVAAAWVASAGAQGGAAGVAKAAAPAIDAQTQLATVKQYCTTCHNDRVKTGGVSFDGLTPEGVAQHPDVFEKAVRKLRGRVMPPPGMKQPEPAASDALIGWLEATLDRAESPA